jgi:hypothetical protein
MVKYTVNIGEASGEIEIVDKTRPKALHDYECCWGWDKPHTIKKGDRYVRVVYKRLTDGSWNSDHICMDCWCGTRS